MNPSTVLAFLHIYKSKKHGGIINSAAASALGRMLNRICKSENIPLVNIVWKQKEVDLLRSEGAEHVILTEGDWQPAYKQLVSKFKLNLLFVSLGGGEVTQKLIDGLELPASVYMYGKLTGGAFSISEGSYFLLGLSVCGFFIGTWLNSLSAEERKEIFSHFSRHLKGDLSTTTYKELHFKDIKEALELSVTHADLGKILLLP